MPRAAKAGKSRPPPNNSAANVGYEAQLWQMADALRGSMDAAEYKHVCLGLLFLKYISDAFTREVNDSCLVSIPGTLHWLCLALHSYV